jgi:hypothetical protein
LFCGRRVEACFEVAAWKLPLPRGDYKTTQPEENIVILALIWDGCKFEHFACSELFNVLYLDLVF